jgi:N-acyl-D-amino-acid deacylase
LRALDGLQLSDYQGWETIAEFLDVINGRNVQNAAAHVPYANVRSLACGFGRGRVDDFQMRSIREAIHKGMAEGAIGLSTGLDYIVQCFTTTEELVEAARVVAQYDGLYATHVRYKTGMMTALAEAVEIGRRSGVRVHISHLKPQSPREAEEILDYIDNVARRDVDFTFDAYPYGPGSTMLSYLLPYDAWLDGPLGALGKLRDPRIRRLFGDGLRLSDIDFNEARIAWVAGKESSRHQGSTIAEYVTQSGLPPEEALADLLIEERLAVLMVVGEGDGALVHPFLAHDCYMMGTDGIFTEDGPVHPRQFGSTGKLLGSCVRDHRLFSLEEAVYKLSGRPAETFRIPGRGILREDSMADVVIFDEMGIADHATLEDPRRDTTGIDAVLVGGTPIVLDGRPLELDAESLPGRRINRRGT